MDVKKRIIQAANALFAEKGFKGTSVNDIVKRAEVSKGGFYHHFTKKEDIVDIILTSYVDDLTGYYDALTEEHGDNVLLAFNGVFEAITNYKTEQIKRWPSLMKMLSFEGNELLIMRMATYFEKATAEYFEKVFRQGNALGVWSVKEAAFTAALWSREVIRVFSEVTPVIMDGKEEAKESLERLLDFNVDLMSTLLDVDPSLLTIKESVMQYVEAAQQAMKEQNNV